MKPGDKTRALAEWGLLTALAVVIGLAGVFLPPLYFFTAVLFPVPLILLVMKLDSCYGLAGLAAAAVFLIIFVPAPAAVVLIVQYGLLGILYGILFKNRVSSGATVSAGLLGACVLALAAACLVYALTGENPFVFDEENVRAAEQWLAENYGAGALKNVPPELQGDFSKKIISFMELFIPGQFVITSAFAAAVTYFLARAVLIRLGFSLPPALAFSRITLPWYSIYGLIAGLGLTLAGDQFSVPAAARAGKNILFVLFYVYLVLGVSVAAYFYRLVSLPGPVKVIFLLMALIYLPFAAALVLALGVTDPLVNLRRLPSLKDRDGL
ncbi:MAG: YybS family protein [Pelotomaculum sp.]|uniref:DUF2232 domain-containing protein n=1 Tax=Pelotomaculum thermopropionicum (strain DSM 13744 / JCM 10971 / SI) TaxID=370438 RepID=A5CY79_PELTS|nr:YybS family protein [Pelotomaculum sp.]BAF61069.1 hypothetical protein PTH_2888 [Pelotomaculum thermopropionicum SI]